VWRAFTELDAVRQYTDSGFGQALQHRDVEAWCRTMRFPLHPAEIVAVLLLDGERRRFDAEDRRKAADSLDGDDE
jgi:hypothetical protein